MTLVFVHGFLGSSLNWSRVLQSLRPKLIKSWEMKSVDLLWHARGQKIDVQGQISEQSFSQLMLDDFKGQLPDGPLLFVAHSFGIRPVLGFVAEQPERCPRVIVEDSLPELSQSGYLFLDEVLRKTPPSFKDRAEAKEYFESRYGVGVLSRFLLSNIGPLEGGGVGWRFSAANLHALLREAKEQALWKEWARYPGKVHLILGEDSYVNHTSSLEEARKLRPITDLLDVVQIPQSGHWVHSDQLELFTDCIAKIANELS